jgi:hypothetical protein
MRRGLSVRSSCLWCNIATALTGLDLELMMKRLMIALLATTTMAFAAPGFAHETPAVGAAAEDQWSNGGATYADFSQEYQHIREGIQHGLSDGSYTRSQADQYFRAMDDIRAQAQAMDQSGRYDSRDTQARLERLHGIMHDAHQSGHALQDRAASGDDWNNGGNSYAEFNDEYQHIAQNIQQGVRDGSYSRRQARSFSRTLQQIRDRADSMQRDGRYDPQDTQARLERLHNMLHDQHDAAQGRQDPYGNSGGSNYRR